MKIYLREVKNIDIINNKNKFDNITTSDLKYNVYLDEYYSVSFYNGFKLTSNFFNKNKQNIVRLYLEYPLNYNYKDLTFSIYDSYSGILIGETKISGYKFIIDINFTPISDSIIIKTNKLYNIFTLYKFEYITDVEYNRLIIDSDINLEINSDFINIGENLIQPYSKSFKVYENEFIRANILNPEFKKFDVNIKSENINLYGELNISEKNENYYNVNFNSYKNNLKNILNKNLSDILSGYVDYNLNDFNNFLNSPDIYKEYGYIFSNEIKTNNFLNSIDKYDFTIKNLSTQLDNSKKINFNTYIRPVFFIKNIFEKIHNYAGYTYILDNEINIDNLILTSKFFDTSNKINEYSLNINNIDITKYGSTLIPIFDDYIKFSNNNAYPNYNIYNKNIIDLLLKNLIFDITLSATTGSEETLILNFELKLYTLNSSYNIDIELDTLNTDIKIITDSVDNIELNISKFNNFNIDYIYSEYGYAFKLLIRYNNTSNIGVFSQYTIKSEKLNIKFDNYYNFFKENSQINYYDLIEKIKLEDFYRSFLKLFNLNVYIDENKKLIEYKRIDFNNYNNINLTKKADIVSNQLKFKDLYNKIKYSYKPDKKEVLYYNYIYNNRLNYENKKEIKIDFNLAYENWQDVSGTTLKYYDPSYLNNSYIDNTFKFNNFLEKDYDIYIQNGIGYLNIINSPTYYIRTWNNITTINTKFPQFSIIENNTLLSFNKNIFDDNIHYRWYYYPDYNEFISQYDKYYKDFNNHIFKNPVKLIVDLYNLTSNELNKIIKNIIIIIKDEKYIAQKITISNNKIRAELIKII